MEIGIEIGTPVNLDEHQQFEDQIRAGSHAHWAQEDEAAAEGQTLHKRHVIQYRQDWADTYKLVYNQVLELATPDIVGETADQRRERLYGREVSDTYRNTLRPDETPQGS